MFYLLPISHLISKLQTHAKNDYNDTVTNEFKFHNINQGFILSL